MNTYVDSRLITLNSKNATKNNGTYNSDVLFNFRGILKEEYDIINAEIELINAQIPVSFYMINYTNNILSYTLGTTKTITLTRGNYTATQFITTLKSAFSANGDIFSISISAITGILTFSSSSNFTFNYSTSTIMGVLGFNASATSTSNNLISSFPLNLASITSLNIISDTLASYNYSSNGGLANSLMTINVDKPNWGVITYQAQGKQSRQLRHKIINSIDIKIEDQDGNLINFNNIGWNLTFSIQIFRHFKINQKLNFQDILKDENQKILNPLGINEYSKSTNEIPNSTNDNKDEDLELLTN